MHTSDVFVKIFSASGSIVALWTVEAFLLMYQHVSAQDLRLLTCKIAAVVDVILLHVQPSVCIQVAHCLESPAALLARVKPDVVVRQLMPK